MECLPPVAVPQPRPSPRGGKAISYSVLRITDHCGAVRYEVVDSLSVHEREKEIQEAYVKAFRLWKPGQNADASLQPPNRPEVRVWRVVMGGPDARDRAEAVAADCRKRELKQPDGTAPRDPVREGSSTKHNEPALPSSKIPGPLVK